MQAAQEFQAMTAKRPRAIKESLDEAEMPSNHEFWDYFNDDDDVDGEAEENGELEEDDSSTFEMVLYR